jgi:hypothetical protein
MEIIWNQGFTVYQKRKRKKEKFSTPFLKSIIIIKNIET